MSVQALANLPETFAIRDANGNRIGAPDAPLWGATFLPPDVGARVVVRVNGIGPGVVVGYFLEEEFLGIRVALDSPPEWYVKQNGAGRLAHAFGTEVRIPGAPMACDDIWKRATWGRGTLFEARTASGDPMGSYWSAEEAWGAVDASGEPPGVVIKVSREHVAR